MLTPADPILTRGDLEEVVRVPVVKLRHLLTHPLELDLPPGQRQGKHRKLSTLEATRVLIAATFMAADIRLSDACAATLLIERAVDGWTGRRNGSDELRYQTRPEMPWLLCVDDRRFFYLRCDMYPGVEETDVVWEIASRRYADYSPHLEAPHLRSVVDLSHVELDVWFKARQVMGDAV